MNKTTLTTESNNTMTGNIHFISLNVRGIREILKRSKIFMWLKRQACDIAFLQETFLSKDIENIVSKEWKSFFNI